MDEEKINKKKKKATMKKIVIRSILAILITIIAFIIYEIATVNNTYYIGEKNLQIPIFVYHNIVEKKEEEKIEYMQTCVERFEEQITGLMKLGYKPISYEELVLYKNGERAIPKWSFLITFDDGYAGVYQYAFEIAKKYNIPMTSFAIDDCVGISDCYYTWEQAKEMQDSGLISIYSHGYRHAKYNEETPENLLEDTKKAYQGLQKNLGKDNLLKVFTYPYGLYTKEQTQLLANNGYVQNLTDNRVNTSSNLDLSGLHRCYPLNDSVAKMLLKIQYRVFRYEYLKI